MEEDTSGPPDAPNSQREPETGSPKPQHGELSMGSATPPSTEVLDLSDQGLRHLGAILPSPYLRQLYLQRNSLCAIPTDLFQLLPHLTWLDLRHNYIRELPPGIGSHRHLRTLLLERNPIRTLPLELGKMTCLRALNLRLCPLEFPPQLVVQKGLAAILQFLRLCEATRACLRDPLPPSQPVTTLLTAGQPVTTLLTAGTSDVQESTDLPTDRTAQELVTCNMNRSELQEGQDAGEWTGAVDPGEDWPSTHEIRRFWTLRQEIVGTEQTEVLAGQLLPLELPPNLQAALQPQKQEAPRGHTKRRRACRATLPALSESRKAEPQAQRLESHRTTALGEPWARPGGQGLQRRGKQMQWKEQRKEPRVSLQVPRDLDAPSSQSAGNLNLQASRRPASGVATWSWEQAMLPKEDTSSPRLDGLVEWQRQELALRCSKPRVEPLEGLRKASQHLAKGRELWEQLARLRQRQTRELPTLTAPQNMFFSTKY